MGERSYRVAAERLREALDLLGRYRGPCLCGHPDARHRVADSIADMASADPAGHGTEDAALEYLPPDLPLIAGSDIAGRIAVAVLAADRARRWLTDATVARIDLAVWADLVTIGRCASQMR